MSDASPGGDGIEEGKRLIRLGGDTGLSLAEKITERFHRLTWRTPIHGLKLNGRPPRTRNCHSGPPGRRSNAAWPSAVGETCSPRPR